MSWVLVLILIGAVIVCIIKNLNSSEDEDYVSDKELRELFIKDYINSNYCVWVKISNLPKSFKIGNVYFDNCCNNKYYQTFLSYVIVDGKVYDNGILSIDFYCNYSYNTTNKDLLEYILDNLDKVEED